MKICWDSLDGLCLTKTGSFVKGTKTYIYKDKCSFCGNQYLTRKDVPGTFCSNSCARSGDNNAMRNPEVVKRNKGNSKGRVRHRKIPLYDTYAKKLSYVEEIRCVYTSDGIKTMEVRCSKCKDWFRPTDRQVWNRTDCLNGKRLGESKFYCLDKCKSECEIYWRSTYPKNFNRDLYGLKVWRDEVFRRASYKCEYCENNATDAHHISPIKLEPFFSLDPDNGIACCEECHYKYGHKEECSTGNLASVICK